MFYKATVQSALLFGSEMWVLTPSTLDWLEGFHVKAARRMTGKFPVLAHGIWTYPKTSEVLAAAGLRNIENFVRVRRARILKWVQERPIYQLCQRAVRRRGTPPRTFWWELPMHLDEATGGRPLLLLMKEKGGGRQGEIPRNILRRVAGTRN